MIIFAHVTIFLMLVAEAISSNHIVLSYSGNGNAKIVSPLHAPDPEFQTNRPAFIPQVPQARWFWSGNQYVDDCPMNITVQDQVYIECLNQKIGIYVTGDNFFDAQFLGQSFSGDNQSHFYYVQIDPIGLQCNASYTFQIRGRNRDDQSPTCFPSNGAALIYGVIQYQGGQECCIDNRYFYDRSICKCIYCHQAIDKCVTCTNKKICLSCPLGYYVIANECTSVCGDSLKTNEEECDDGNLFDGDGCSRDCRVQSYYNCTNTSLTKSTCLFNATFRVYVKYVLKEYYQNTITIVMRVLPHLWVLDDIHMLSAFFHPDTLEDVSFNYSNTLLFLTYNYSQTLQSQTLPFSFDLSRVHHNYSIVQPVRINVTMVTNANIPIVHFSQGVYTLGRLLKTVYLYLVIVLGLVMVVGIIVNKSMAVDVALVFQVSFFSLSSTHLVHPLLTHMFQYKIINGYPLETPGVERYTPDSVFAIQYFKDISSNYLLSLAIISAIFLFYLSLEVIDTVMRRKQIVIQLKDQFNDLLVACGLFFAISGGYSIGLEIRYGSNSIFSLALGGGIIMGFIGMSAVQFYFSEGEFKTMLKSGKQSQLYYNISLGYRFCLGLVMSCWNDLAFVPYFTLSLSICFLVYQLSTLPFLNSYQNYVSIFTKLSTSSILLMRMLFSLTNLSIWNVGEPWIISTGIAEITLLCACCLLSLITLKKQLVKCLIKLRKGYCKSKWMLKEMKMTRRMLRVQTED